MDTRERIKAITVCVYGDGRDDDRTLLVDRRRTGSAIGKMRGYPLPYSGTAREDNADRIREQRAQVMMRAFIDRGASLEFRVGFYFTETTAVLY